MVHLLGNPLRISSLDLSGNMVSPATLAALLNPDKVARKESEMSDKSETSKGAFESSVDLTRLASISPSELKELRLAECMNALSDSRGVPVARALSSFIYLESLSLPDMNIAGQVWEILSESLGEL
jgi:hypothetical protein